MTVAEIIAGLGNFRLRWNHPNCEIPLQNSTTGHAPAPEPISPPMKARSKEVPIGAVTTSARLQMAQTVVVERN